MRAIKKTKGSWRVNSLGFRSAFRAEFGAFCELCAALRAVSLAFNLCTAFGAELRIGCQGGFTLGTGSPDTLAPALFGQHLAVFFSHLGVCPDFLDGPAGLGG